MDLLDQLEASFNHEPVSIVDFAQSPRFCNRTLYPRQRLLLKLFFLEELTDDEHRILEHWQSGGRRGSEIELSPDVLGRMQTLRDQGFKHFREIVLVGGRRCSKGFVTGLSLAKKMYDTLQLQDPGRHYGIDVDKEICFSCVAASLDQAKDTQYADFSSMVNSCFAMQRYIHKVQHLEFSVATESDLRKLESWKRQKRVVERDISKLRGKALPANARTIRGSATMALVFDEFAHFQQGESDQADSQVYAAAKPSLAQFGRDALIFCNSSPYSKVGTFFERYETGMATDNGAPENPEVLTLRFPSWALYEGWWEDPTYKGPQKCIMVSPDWDPDEKKDDGNGFYTDDDRAQIFLQRQEEQSDPVKFKVETRGQFSEVVDAYLMPEMVDRMFAGRPAAWDENRNEWIFEKYAPNFDFSTYEHRYYAHLDPSSTTAGFGFALGHTEIFELPGERAEEHVVFDIIKRWNPKDFPGGAIDWDPILAWVLNIANLFRPVQISFDMFNTDYPITWLNREFRKRRIETRVFKKVPTSQTNWDRAEIFRTALYRNLIHAPHTSYDEEIKLASDELKFLQEVKSGKIPRVEKQDTGPVQTKDMADCMMEVVEATIGDIMAKTVRQDLGTQPVRVGAPGGYPLGGQDRGGYGRPIQPTNGANRMAEFYERNQRNISKARAAKGNPARRFPGRRGRLRGL
jgi:hypothetical protein